MAGTRTAVFLSYRREDTKHVAGRLGDRLTQRFDDVFMDIDTLEPGVDFAAAIRRAVGECDVLLALIGENWVDAVDDQGARRLDDPDDWIVQEIKVALDRNIRVVPVLVDSVPMPRRSELPEVLTPLADRHAAALRYESFDSDAESLITAVERALAPPADDVPRVDLPGDDTSTIAGVGPTGVPDGDLRDGKQAPVGTDEVDDPARPPAQEAHEEAAVGQPDETDELGDPRRPPAEETPEEGGTDQPDDSGPDGTGVVDGPTEAQREADARRRRRRRRAMAAALALVVIGAAAAAWALLRGPEPPPGIPWASPLPLETIVVPVEESSGSSALFLVDSDVGTVGDRVDTGGHKAGSPVLAPGRGAVVYQTQTSTQPLDIRMLRVVAVDGTGDRELFDRPEDCQWMLRPSWNPVELDQIAVPCLDYKVDGQPLEFSLRIYTLDGEVVRALETGRAWLDDVSFSPNGETVTYAMGPGDDAPVIYSRPADGGPSERLAEGRDPMWSPDGARIVFSSPADHSDPERPPSTIRVMDPDGSNVEDLTAGPFADRNPGWSPDGEQVVFLSNRGSADGTTLRAWLVDADGRDEPRELLPGEAGSMTSPPAWASR
ncbi:TIR domain-containing protein [Georgenia subflava]|uniref:TIR domain-containing protein n=1 Tax=Georgenia subflava TaxID=1622177 RepID=A0A6N7EHC2_9MICO|nr:TIR domain-containing protein [Georgenia subflava]MPV36543.1 TIR domain-containing protein [Georgenia subflava]